MAGRIPQSFIDEILSRVDIIDIIDGYVPLKKAGKNHQALCPFHEEKTPSFTVSQQKQFYHCFGCGANGTVISFLMDYAGMDFIEVIETLAARMGMEVPREDSVTAYKEDFSELYELMQMVANYYCQQLREHPQATRAVEYLKSRDISGKIAAEFELGYAPPGWDNLINQLGISNAAKQRLARVGMILQKTGGGFYDRFRDRIMFPIRDQRGRVIGFGGRIIDQGTPKYLNSPETPIFHKGRELYGLYQARHKNKHLDQIHVVEGYMDVIALAQFNIWHAVASLGTAVTTDQLEKVFKQTSQVIFTFDSDEAGRQAAWRALDTVLPLLKEGRRCFFQFLPMGEDPDSYVRKKGNKVFQDTSEATALSDFLLDRLKDNLNLDTREGQAAMIEQSLPYLEKLPPSALRKIIIKDIATLTSISTDVFEELIREKDRDKIKHKIQPGKYTLKQKREGSHISKVISILLQYPQIDQKDYLEQLDNVEMPGIGFLRELMTFIKSRPEITCGGILEHWRDSKYSNRLTELASTDLLLSELPQLETELSNLIDRIINSHQTSLRNAQRKDLLNNKNLHDQEAQKVLRRMYPGKSNQTDNKSN